jgi:hypothetical protein
MGGQMGDETAVKINKITFFLTTISTFHVFKSGTQDTGLLYTPLRDNCAKLLYSTSVSISNMDM